MCWHKLFQVGYIRYQTPQLIQSLSEMEFGFYRPIRTGVTNVQTNQVRASYQCIGHSCLHLCAGVEDPHGVYGRRHASLMYQTITIWRANKQTNKQTNKHKRGGEEKDKGWREAYLPHALKGSVLYIVICTREI